MPRSSTTSAGESADAADATVHTRVAGEVLATLDHELRSPLNAIAGLSELLGSQAPGSLTDKQRDFVELIGEAGERLQRILEDLVHLAAPDRSWVDTGGAAPIAATIERIETLLREIATVSGLTLTTRSDASLGTCADDPAVVRRILTLLAWSVVTSASDGSEVVLSAARSSDGAILAVRAGSADLRASADGIEEIAGRDPLVGAALVDASRHGIGVAGARAGTDVVYEIAISTA